MAQRGCSKAVFHLVLCPLVPRSPILGMDLAGQRNAQRSQQEMDVLLQLYKECTGQALEGLSKRGKRGYISSTCPVANVICNIRQFT